ncbi:hypothetical protein T03_9926 [Trichinella britovi]|uniref:Uncharacterized protein n=1 Tax=Trichinella britovi TaxID=45882 RepID=A0A0V1CVV4_TRIBR|nr:hypothetical protein T03_9926 [Trichinella britovi]
MFSQINNLLYDPGSKAVDIPQLLFTLNNGNESLAAYERPVCAPCLPTRIINNDCCRDHNTITPPCSLAIAPRDLNKRRNRCISRVGFASAMASELPLLVLTYNPIHGFLQPTPVVGCISWAWTWIAVHVELVSYFPIGMDQLGSSWVSDTLDAIIYPGDLFDNLERPCPRCRKFPVLFAFADRAVQPDCFVGSRERVSEVGCQLFDVFAGGRCVSQVRVERYIHWESQRAHKQHFEGRVSCGFMHGCIVGKSHLWDSRFPRRCLVPPPSLSVLGIVLLDQITISPVCQNGIRIAAPVCEQPFPPASPNMSNTTISIGLPTTILSIGALFTMGGVFLRAQASHPSHYALTSRYQPGQKMLRRAWLGGTQRVGFPVMTTAMSAGVS